MKFRAFCLVLIIFPLACAYRHGEPRFDLTPEPQPLMLTYTGADDRVLFGLDQLQQALNRHAHEVMMAKTESDMASQAGVAVRVDASFDTGVEGFEISQSQKGHWQVSAQDGAGAMYGLFELAEQVETLGWSGVKPSAQRPHMAMRGTKFNIPLDVRTPSYSHAGDPAQHNIETVWDFEFWRAYIDQLAEHRYNFISLWSLHPFPSLVKVPEYPKVALDDVQKSTVDWQEYYSLWAIGLDAPEIVNQTTTLKQISIEEKIAFWRKVMAYGKQRNVEFYVITWNVFVNGTAGQYGITDDMQNPITQDYFRKSVKSLILTYPDLAGVGLTTGEYMRGATAAQKEDWVYSTYGQGVLDAVKADPTRKIKLIHRQHQSDSSYIRQKFAPLVEHPNVDFIYSFKYAKAHIHSAVTQPYHEKFVENIGDLKTIWTMRNDSVYYFRWGAPEFMRAFLQNVPMAPTLGVYYGSDQWVWGRDFTSRDKTLHGKLELDKHWYHWMQFGRLAYNPALDDAFFVRALAARFPGIAAQSLFDAWQNASMVYPLVTGMHWGALDFQWYIEGCKSRPRQAWNETGFHDINTFLIVKSHPYSGVQSISDFVKQGLHASTRETNLKTPLDVVQELRQRVQTSRQALEQVKKSISTSRSDKHMTAELAATLKDIDSLNFMADYYASKIEGASYYGLFLEHGDVAHQQQAIASLTDALGHWRNYVASAMSTHKNPVWLNRVGHVDWQQITEWVAQDIDIAAAAQKR